MKKAIAILAIFSVAIPAFALEKPLNQDGIMKKVVNMEERGEARREFKDKMISAKEKVMAARGEFNKVRESAKSELKVKLAKIKDSKKREAVERIDKSINDLNNKRTDQYTNVLTKLSQLLDRILERTDRAAAKGIDVIAVKTAIGEARSAIDNAGSSIKVQSEKIYKITVTDEATLKQKVGEARQALNKDLNVLHNVIKGAKEAVRKAATLLAQIPKIKNEVPEVVSPIATTTNVQ